MRKVFGILLKNWPDLVLAKEEGKKVIYGSYPPSLPSSWRRRSGLGRYLLRPLPESVVSTSLVPLFGPGADQSLLEMAERNGLPRASILVPT